MFEPLLLPDDAKEALVLSLLDEFGVDRIRRQGDEFLVRCVMPWHEDRHPSARLNWRNLVYSCFSCRSSGGLLWLISTVRGVPGPAAREWITGATGLDGEDMAQFEALLDAIFAEGDEARGEPIPSYSHKVLEPWAFVHPWLTDPWEDGGRAIPEENIERLEIGYAEAYPVSKTQTSERIIIPHFWGQKLVGWQSRRLWDDGTPKYLSTEGFPKDSTLYAAPDDFGMAVVVESPMSVARHIHHLPMVATFGSDVTDRQVRLLARYERVVLFPDNDNAGWGWLMPHPGKHPGGERAPLAETLEHLTDVEVVPYDWAVDPADMDDATVQGLVDGAVPLALWDRPSALRCWECKTVHTGECRKEDDGDGDVC